MKTTDIAVPDRTERRKLLPPVCPVKFDKFFGPCLEASLATLDLDALTIPERYHIGDHIAVAMACTMYPNNANLASAMVRRYQCLIIAIDNGVLIDIGERFFSDPNYLVDNDFDHGISVKHIAVMAAAFADLLDGNGDTFRTDSLSAAILAIPSGCPFTADDCVDDCNAPRSAAGKGDR